MRALEEAATIARDKLIVRLLADTGMRLGELIILRDRDVYQEGGKSYLNIYGKTGGRKVGIDAAVYYRVRAYLQGGRYGEPAGE